MTIYTDVNVVSAINSTGALDILWHLRHEGPCRQQELCRALKLSAPTVSRALAELERIGIVRNDGWRTPYELAFASKTEQLIQAAADLAEQAAQADHEQARERAAALRKRGMAARTRSAKDSA